MRISQRLIALSNVCLFKWDQNINHARQVIKAWWSQIYVGNVQQNFVKLSFEFSTTHPMTEMMKRYMRAITCSPALKSPIVPRSHFYCWLKFFMDANCSDYFSIMPLKSESKLFHHATKIGIKIFCHATKIGIKNSTKNWNKKFH